MTTPEASVSPLGSLDKKLYGQSEPQNCGAIQYRNFWMFLLCLSPVVGIFAGQTAGDKTPSVDSIVSRMVKARMDNQTRFQPYTVTRDYRLFGKQDTQAKSQVTAEITFVPPTSKNYRIRASSGAGMGEGIVRKMLASEVELTDDQSSELTTENYDFRLVGEESCQDGRCFVLEINPKRTQKQLIKGKIWVDSQTFMMRRLEGAPAKKPSWWVKDIHVILFYNEVNGMWLQTGLVATADVRIVGPCKMVSRDVQYSILDMASNQDAPRQNARRRVIFPSNAMVSD
jgi:hypothetical protein